MYDNATSYIVGGEAKMDDSFRVDFTDNSQDVLNELELKKELALIAVGMTMEGHAKRGCPVDTGRLRNSITFATKSRHSSGKAPASSGDYEEKSEPKEDTVYVGTNVEYAQSVEMSDSAKHKVGGAHFLRNSAADHTSQYEKLIKAALK